MKCILTVGPSSCGKSTCAAELTKQGYVEVNRDNVRFSVIVENSGITDWSLYKFNKANEGRVTEVCNQQIFDAVLEKKPIILSDTNLNPKYRNALIEKMQGYGYDVEIKDDWDIPHFETLLKRNEARQGGISTTILWNQWLQYLEYKGHKKYQPTGRLLECIIADIDGTVASHTGIRSPFDWDKVGLDKPREHVVSLVKGLSDQGYEIVFLSGRDGCCRQETINWLNNTFNGYFGYDLHMREKGDCRKDYIVKKELFDVVSQEYDVAMVVDDRHQIISCWEEMGLNVINVGSLYNRF